MCCDELTTSMTGVGPGNYSIDFHWIDMTTGPQHVVFQVTVPDEGQPEQPAEGPYSRSPCIEEEPTAGGDTAGGRIVLLTAQPNPVTDQAVIRFRIAAGGRTVLAVFSSAGRLVRTLIDEDLEAGGHAVVWDRREDGGRRLAPGVYFCWLTSAGGKTSRNLLMLP